MGSCSACTSRHRQVVLAVPTVIAARSPSARVALAANADPTAAVKGLQPAHVVVAPTVIVARNQGVRVAPAVSVGPIADAISHQQPAPVAPVSHVVARISARVALDVRAVPHVLALRKMRLLF